MICELAAGARSGGSFLPVAGTCGDLRRAPVAADHRAVLRSRLLAPLLACLATLVAPSTSQPALASDRLTVDGLLTLRLQSVRAPVSSLDGGWGRLAVPGGGEQVAAEGGSAQAQLGLRWQPTLRLAAYAHVLGRSADEALGGDRFALVEGYVEGQFFARTADELRLRLGAQLLPTSRANRDALWQSPWTVSFSAIDTWIGEEVRPVGLDARYLLRTAGGDEWTLAAAPFGGNDSAGTLLAWRGWSLGDRLTGVGEVLALPPLGSLGDGFAGQRDDGTRPTGRDLDGRLGWHARIGWERPGRARLATAFYANRGDRELYRGEYAWATRFAIVSGELESGRWRLLGQALRGGTGMGRAGTPAWVEMDFAAADLMVAWQGERTTLAMRGDWFRTIDRDHSPRGERNDEDGTAWTVSLRQNLGRGLVIVAEVLAVDAERPGLAAEGQLAAPTARRALLELRWVF